MSASSPSPDQAAAIRDLIATGRSTLVSIDHAAKAIEQAARSVDQAATVAQSSALKAAYLSGFRDGGIAFIVILTVVLVLAYLWRSCRA